MNCINCSRYTETHLLLAFFIAWIFERRQRNAKRVKFTRATKLTCSIKFVFSFALFFLFTFRHWSRTPSPWLIRLSFIAFFDVAVKMNALYSFFVASLPSPSTLSNEIQSSVFRDASSSSLSLHCLMHNEFSFNWISFASTRTFSCNKKIITRNHRIVFLSLSLILWLRYRCVSACKRIKSTLTWVSFEWHFAMELFLRHAAHSHVCGAFCHFNWSHLSLFSKFNAHKFCEMWICVWKTKTQTH